MPFYFLCRAEEEGDEQSKDKGGNRKGPLAPSTVPEALPSMTVIVGGAPRATGSSLSVASWVMQACNSKMCSGDGALPVVHGLPGMLSPAEVPLLLRTNGSLLASLGKSC